MLRRGSASTRSRATSRTARDGLANAAAECSGRRGGQRTCGVSKLVLLALYPVLQRLRIASGYLDLLLDGFLVHVGHALRCCRAWRGDRERREAARQADPGGRAGRDARTPGHGLEQRSAASSSGDGRGAGQLQLRAHTRGRARGLEMDGSAEQSGAEARGADGPG